VGREGRNKEWKSPRKCQHRMARWDGRNVGSMLNKEYASSEGVADDACKNREGKGEAAPLLDRIAGAAASTCGSALRL